MQINRKPPRISPPGIQPKQDRVHQVRTYKLITPLFGGGAEPQKPDEVTVIRASEIRGLLRFWWRATRGGQFGSLDELRCAEEAIWGSAAGEGKAGPSPVALAVEVTKRGRRLSGVKIRTRRGEDKVAIGHPRSPYSYVAFPLREERQGRRVTRPAGSVWKDIEFKLHITLDQQRVQNRGELDLREEVEAALWAWETFGGVGARTRRGFGALQLIAVDDTPIGEQPAREIERTVRRQLGEYVKGNRWPPGISHLHPDMPLVVTSRYSDADKAWKALFGALKRFRQARYPDAQGRPYGRSKWPEPDAIRRLTGTHSPGHEPQHPVDAKYPRGRFGLPIIFQFKQNDQETGDPPPTVLEGAQSERFASRLILRPYACQDGAVGIACALQGPLDPPGGYVLKEQSSSQILAQANVDLTSKEAQQIDPLGGELDVLKAFLRTLG